MPTSDVAVAHSERIISNPAGAVDVKMIEAGAATVVGHIEAGT